MAAATANAGSGAESVSVSAKRWRFNLALFSATIRQFLSVEEIGENYSAIYWSKIEAVAAQTTCCKGKADSAASRSLPSRIAIVKRSGNAQSAKRAESASDRFALAATLGLPVF